MPLRTRSEVKPNFLMAIPAIALVCVFVFVPYVNIGVMSLRTQSTTDIYGPSFTFENYTNVVTDSFYWGLLFDTLAYAGASTLLCLILAYPTAFHLARTQPRWRGLLYAGVLSPLLTGVVVRCFGWIVLLSNTGLVNQALGFIGLGPYRLMYRPAAVIVAVVHVFLPYMVLPIMNAIQAIDPRLEEAARTLGASRVTVFRKIIFPLSIVGVQSGITLVFVLSASVYVIPMLLGGGQVQTLATVVVQKLLGSLLWPSGAALALFLSLNVVAVLLVINRALFAAIRRVV
jgi:putative spermidine/putrescine transport system permease protein